MIAAEAEAMGLGAALVVGDVWWDGGWKGASEEARACGRAVPYHSGTTGPMKAGATHGTPWSFPWIGPTWGVGPGGQYSTGVLIRSRGWCHFGGHPTHSVLETLRLRSRLSGSATGRTEFPSPLEGFPCRGVGGWGEGCYPYVVNSSPYVDIA